MNKYFGTPFKALFLPLFFFLLMIPFANRLDLSISHFFFEENQFQTNGFWDFVYVYGLAPAWILVIVALFGALLSVAKKFRKYAKPCLYLLLTFAIGAGLIVHGGLKDHWGRPRPRQTLEFGGLQPFRPFYAPHFEKQEESSKSFSCGHCSMGFYFFSLAFLGLYWRSKKIYWIGLFLAWSLGLLLSLTRIAQGGHYFSDTVTSALIMWLTAYFFASYFLKQPKDREEKE